MRERSKGTGSARGAPDTPFQRFPTWMWRNTQVEAFTEWLRAHNEKVPAATRAGFFGLDIYNMRRGSIAAVLDYLDEVDPDAAAVARERYGCLTPWQKEPSTYGRAVLTEGFRTCEGEVVRQCQDPKRQLHYARGDSASFLDAAQNARLIASAERYYRIMYYGGADSWNLRDTHMFETLVHLLDAHGEQARAVVWAHNSHIGDARFIPRWVSIREELNIGQLCRERFGDTAALIGFGTHTGTVAAASEWDGPMEVKRCARRGRTLRALCHESGRHRFLLDLRGDETVKRRPGRATARTVYRCDLSPRDRADEPLRRGVAGTAVRRFCLVRRNNGCDAAAS